ncbi:ubiquinol cytochrome C oxidoreductase [Phenylobacterium sp. Root77]|jgi:quinol-cytochrome oxidoreductase complex cytochrome b subunit|uniref:cytochrome b n=1 Tax=unclassified Phenylobacterium TaxID=2640670 RepID=UPI0006F902D8|nr:MULTISPECIES: cytochrome b/b6 [unclassified Phenylobacterium]KQW73058.1 ubiquinol cytochrome C oxidoreductase [Phenylobacterium sp. Root1277]KQW92278.1 ubiquinol cytochrome C oxidoreductase [Phenylobacterium sp. Root1290]KRC40509.1 ubiquinol cytochrome C oxidoreductase [Phenylobacterium sp. Root77]
MSGHSNYEPKTGIERWLDTRLPVVRLAYDSMIDFPTPKNLNYWWTFGGILAVCLGIQLVTGIVLAMHYVPHVDHAFASVERIMRDVNYGWLIRYMHANGASMFFIAVYIHMFRGLYYGSYKAPREVLWILGCVIYLLMMATAFMGYVLPWGQMSFHGAVVITNLFGALPVVGEAITTWLWGGFAVDNPTLNRFFSLHFLLPFMIAGVVGLHIWALHVPGNNNPTGVNVKSKEDTVPFHPYYTVKDGFAIVVFLIMFATFVFYNPNALGHADNYIPGNPLVTPAHIVPEWYFLPFYAILRAVPDKLGGVLLMFGAIAVLFVLPWLDTSKVRSMRYRPTAKLYFFIFLLACLVLGYCGGQLPDDHVIPHLSTFKLLDADLNSFVWLSRIATLYYFAYFLVILPVLGLTETPLPLPESISEPVLSHPANAPAGAAASPEKRG